MLTLSRILWWIVRVACLVFVNRFSGFVLSLHVVCCVFDVVVLCLNELSLLYERISK